MLALSHMQTILHCCPNQSVNQSINQSVSATFPSDQIQKHWDTTLGTVGQLEVAIKSRFERGDGRERGDRKRKVFQMAGDERLKALSEN